MPKSDILNEAVSSLSVATSYDDPNNLEESSDPLHPIKAPPANMLGIFLSGIGGMTTLNDQVNTATAHQVCENEMYQLLLGNDFKMNMQNIEKTVYNCPLSRWKSSAHRFEFANHIKTPKKSRSQRLRANGYFVNKTLSATLQP